MLKSLYAMTLEWIFNVVEQIQKTILVFIKPGGITWMLVSYGWLKGMIQLSGMEYVVFCSAIVGIKTWKRIEKIRQGV